MSYQILIEKDAEKDIDDIIAWYEKEQAGLGVSFIKHFEEAINIIAHNPTIFQIVYKDARHILLGKFPYSIYYYVNELQKEVVVYTVIHQHRNQKVWKRRTNKLM